MFGRRKKWVDNKCPGCREVSDALWDLRCNVIGEFRKILAAYWLCDGDRKKFDRAMKFLNDTNTRMDGEFWKQLTDIRIDDVKGD